VPRLPEWLLLVHLLVLASFAVVQPTLSVLANSIEFFFPARRVTGELFVLTLVLYAVLPSLVLWLLGVLIGRGRQLLRWRLHLVAVWIFTALFGAYLARQWGAGLIFTMLLTLGLSIGFTYLYGRREAVRSIVSVLGPAPLVFVLYFLAFTDASHLVTGTEPDVASGHTRRPVPVVVYILDELPAQSLMARDGKVDRARFPNIARLAGQSTWYRTTLPDAWTTFEAVPAILSGKHQSLGKLPVVFDHPQNLFTLFRDDYDEHVVESFTRLCPLSVCPNSASGPRRVRSLLESLALTYGTVVTPELERKLPTPGNTFSSVLASLHPKDRINPDDYEVADLRLFPGPQFDRFLEQVRSPRPGDRKAPLYLLHSNLPHNPWNHVPDGRLYRDHSKRELGLDVNTEQWDRDLGAVLEGWQRHLLQTQFADRLVGRLMRKLRQTGIYDKAVVVVVADHGVSFIPGSNRRKPRPDNLADIGMVPLFVKMPEQRTGKIEDRPVSTIDVLPTLASAAGMRIPWRVDGMPLPRAAASRDRKYSMLLPNGGRVLLRPALLERRRRATLASKVRLFGSGAGGPGFYGIGPARSFVGRAPRLGVPVAGSAHLDDGGDFADVDLSGPFVPALVRGRVDGAPTAVRSVAVEVNGRVMGSGFLSGNQFEVMVDPRAFRDGRNDVRMLAVTGASGGVRLHAFRGG
jgi:hypothetical protein